MTALLTDSIAERGQAYTELVGMVRRRGEGALHGPERDLLFDAADAMLFGEEESAEKLEGAQEMLASLSDSGRWTQAASEEISAQLSLIGS